jgi:hypothetical protein
MVQGTWNITIKTPMGDKSGAVIESPGNCESAGPREGVAVPAPPYIDGCRSSPATRYCMCRPPRTL